MKKPALLIIVCLMLVVSNLYAANGDLVVNGNVGVGTNPNTKLSIVTSTPLDGILSSDGTRWLRLVSGTTSNGSWNPIVQANDNVLIFSNSQSYTGQGNFVIAPWSTTMSGIRMDGLGNVGIGTPYPTQKLHINGSSPAINLENADGNWGSGGSVIFGHSQEGSSNAIAKIYSQLTDGSGANRAGNLFFQTASGGSLFDRITILSGGNIGIGTPSPVYKLDINGGDLMVRNGVLRSGQRSNFYLDLQGDRNFVLYDNGVAVWMSGSQTSDVRLKKNIVPLTEVLPKIAKLNGVRFNWIDESWGSQPEIGVIAQEVEKVFPEIVSTDQKSGYKLVHYEKLTPVLLEAVKELQTENDGLREKVLGLEEKIAQIEKRLERVILR